MHPLITQLKLLPHPEGGYYREVYRSQQQVESPVHQQRRDALTSIYFLLLKGQVSRFHKVLHDETWHFYQGAPLRLIDLSNTADEIILGDVTNPSYQHTIQASHWQAAETTGEYSLVGCNVAPGFDFEDFSFLTEQEAQDTASKYPQCTRFI